MSLSNKLIIPLSLIIFFIALGVFQHEPKIIILLSLALGGLLTLVLMFIKPDALYYIYLSSLFVSRPIFSVYPFSLILSDFIFIILLLLKLSPLFTENRDKLKLTNYNTDRKILIPYILFLLVVIFTTLVNTQTAHTKAVILGAGLSIYRMFEMGIILIIFSDKNFKFNLNYIQILTFILLILQFPADIVSNEPTIVGTFFHHHASLGTFVIIPLFISIQAMKLKDLSFNIKIISIINIIISFVLLFISEARSALLGFLIAIAIWFVVNLKFSVKNIAISIGLVLLSVIVVIATPLKMVFLKTFVGHGQVDLSTYSRFIIWRDSIDYYKSYSLFHKLFGVGMMYLREVFHVSFFREIGTRLTSSSHNNYLNVFMETGIIGAIFFYTFYITILVKLIKKFKATKDPMIGAMVYISIAYWGSSIAQETFWPQPFVSTSILAYYVYFSIFYNQRYEI